MDSMDFAALDTKKGAEAGFEVQLAHPHTAAPLPLWIMVLGKDASLYQSTARTQNNKRIERLARANRVTLTAQELADDTLDLLVTVTVAWRSENGATLDGEPFPKFSPAAVKAFYLRFPWVREQVDAAIHDRGNFLPGSAKG
jgi:hypothetical protein